MRKPKRDKRTRLLNSPEKTSELIVQQAERLIAKHGVDGLRFSDIAEALGIKVPAIYAHYPGGRADVLAHVGRRTFNAMAEHFPDNHLDLATTMLAGVRDFVRYWHANPAHGRLLLRDIAQPDGLPEVTAEFGGPGSPEAVGALRELRERLTSLLTRGNDAKVFRKVDYAEFYNGLLGITLVNLFHPQVPSNTTTRELGEILEKRVTTLVMNWLFVEPSNTWRP